MLTRYRQRLAPISGSIETGDRSPLAAAWRELREETTLTPASLELLRQGKPYTFSDPSVGREWTVYPFAFRLRPGGEARIKTDWEHESWSWYDPLQVSDDPSFLGVPRLAESLRRVWFERDLGQDAGEVLTAGLEDLRTDHQSGARQLAGKALSLLRDVVAAVDGGDTYETWWAKVRGAAWHIWKNGRESMGAAILSVLLEALKHVEDTLRSHHGRPGPENSKQRRDAAVESLEGRLALRAAAEANPISEAFVKFLREEFGTRERGATLSILTLSESSTISTCLRKLVLETDFVLDLRVLESRPLFEGVSLAAALAESVLSEKAPLGGLPHRGQDSPPARVKLVIYTDAAAALAAAGIDVVLVGADRISASGSVSNKTGSLPAVLSARHASPDVKTVVLSESEKIAPPGAEEEHVVEENDPAQLESAWKGEFNNARVRVAAASLARALGDSASGGFDGVEVGVSNVFFEWVPHSLVDTYVTEFGVWTRHDIVTHSERLGAEEKRLFGDF